MRDVDELRAAHLRRRPWSGQPQRPARTQWQRDNAKPQVLVAVALELVLAAQTLVAEWHASYFTAGARGHDD